MLKLFPIHHGILDYPSIEVLPPFVLYGMTGQEGPASAGSTGFGLPARR